MKKVFIFLIIGLVLVGGVTAYYLLPSFVPKVNDVFHYDFANNQVQHIRGDEIISSKVLLKKGEVTGNLPSYLYPPKNTGDEK